MRSKDDNGGNDPENRNVAEYRGGSWSDAVEGIGGRNRGGHRRPGCSTRLPLSAVGAECGVWDYFASATRAIGHVLFKLTKSYSDCSFGFRSPVIA